MKIPEHIRSNAEGYIALTADTLDSLAFLHDNIGVKCELDLSQQSIEHLGDTLKWLYNHPDPEELFPDLIETYAQLLAQYVALVYLERCQCKWGIDSARRSAHFGQPFVDVVPTEPWRRYYPIHWQIALKNRDVVFSDRVWPLVRQVKDNLASRERYEVLLAAIIEVVRTSREGAIRETELLDVLSERGFAPNKAQFCAAAREFPKRVAAVLRKSGCFSKRPSDKAWRFKRGFVP